MDENVCDICGEVKTNLVLVKRKIEKRSKEITIVYDSVCSTCLMHENHRYNKNVWKKEK